MVIDSFRGKHSFLSNFHTCNVVYENYRYPSVEHAFQCQKTFDQNERNKILLLPDGNYTPPNICKRIARNIKLRSDWDFVKDKVMYRCLVEKFSDVHLAKLLLDTSDAQLIEGNWWGDTYWGVYKGKGKNKLGEMLMSIRGMLQ